MYDVRCTMYDSLITDKRSDIKLAYIVHLTSHILFAAKISLLQSLVLAVHIVVKQDPAVITGLTGKVADIKR
jgi:hypothetical protein